MFNPFRPRIVTLFDLELEFDSEQTTKLIMENLTFEVYKVPDDTYTFRVWHHRRKKPLIIRFGVDRAGTEHALFRAQALDRNPQLLETFVPTIH